MRLNADDNGRRRFIQIQTREPIRPNSEAEQNDRQTIDQIGIERIQLAAEKIREENPSAAALDLGFKLYTVIEAPQEMADRG